MKLKGGNESEKGVKTQDINWLQDTGEIRVEMRWMRSYETEGGGRGDEILMTQLEVIGTMQEIYLQEKYKYENEMGNYYLKATVTNTVPSTE